MRECTYCKSPIVKTKSNPEQKCAYKLCDGFGFNRIDGDGVALVSNKPQFNK